MEKIFNNDDILREKYMVINCNVYDITKYMGDHPGGDEILKENLGGDAREAFEDIGHSNSAYDKLKEFKIGVLADCQPLELIRDDSDDSMYYMIAFFIVMMSGLVFAVMKLM